HRRSTTPDEVTKAIRDGIVASLASGTTLVGDIAAGGISAPLLAASPLKAVAFYELIGLTRSRAKEAWRAAEAWLAAQPGTDHYRPGLGPHAPYTVRRSLLRVAAARAARDALPLAMHLGETADELRL